MPQMIAVASGFQSSVNIAYDLNDKKKLNNYIPTKSAMKLLQDVLYSTRIDATDRARILIGPYGKGKSHIVLMILSILMKKDLGLFEKMLPVLKRNNPELYNLVLNYYEGNQRLLPVVISGSNNSISQAFMNALQKTLQENELDDIMPSSSFKAAVNIIDMWKQNYPETFENFSGRIEGSVNDFKERLLDFDPTAIDTFEELYPTLTAGSIFNPFAGFGVIEIYEEVIKSLKEKGFTGIYIIYDEFSKYLENHISESTKNDTKILQDLAEKCGRSGAEELHLMLISHKEITSYLDKASKQAIDGWRGVSERFQHVYLNNNFSQTYEIIASAIQKDEIAWEVFCTEHEKDFANLDTAYAEHPIFADLYESGIDEVIRNCYPLHPVSTFILPRLSERVAQNERTLFTFISAPAESTLYAFLEEHGDREFRTVTPDVIYDYFEPLLKQEVYSGSLHQYYFLTTTILRNLDSNSLEARLVKTLSLIYVLEQFEKLAPTMDELVGIYSVEFAPEIIKASVKNLIENKFVIYLKRSNNYLKLKETSGVDVREEISKVIEKQAGKVSLKKTLNEANFNNYLFPSRYNDEKEMTRYFAFEYINADEAKNNVNWTIKSERINADGVVFAILPNSLQDIEAVKNEILVSSKDHKRCLFIIPRHFKSIEATVLEYEAVRVLKNASEEDTVLYEDYELVHDDLQEVIQKYISDFTHPENDEAVYLYDGNVVPISRKTDLSNVLSDICDFLYPYTPVICNEVINRDELTTTTSNSRNKIIAGLLRNELEPNLGLTGSGQEVSIMRSTLLRTGILRNDGKKEINLEPEDPNLKYLFKVIIDFMKYARAEGSASFAELYHELETDEKKIGLRKGLIPIFLSVVFHVYKKELIISDRIGQVQINLDTVLQINASPELFTVSFMDWDDNKESYVNGLEKIFEEHMGGYELTTASYQYLQGAMRRWYMGLPKYAKNIKVTPVGERISKENKNFIQEFRKNTGAYELLFKRLPEIFGVEVGELLLARIEDAKKEFDNALPNLKKYVISKIKESFMASQEMNTLQQMSLTSVIKDWCDELDVNVFDQLFTDGTDKILKIFRNVTNDEDELLKDLAKTVTGLRMEDWDFDTVMRFFNSLEESKKTAEAFSMNEEETANVDANIYQLIYVDNEGKSVVKRFEKVDESRRGKLLYNSIISQINAMGQSISEQEKRQILMEVLKGLC